jgi:hypothetical protein
MEPPVRPVAPTIRTLGLAILRQNVVILNDVKKDLDFVNLVSTDHAFFYCRLTCIIPRK